MKWFPVTLSVVCLLSPGSISGMAEDPSPHHYRIGCGSADITGPMLGVQFWGFVRTGQTGIGLHLRQRARAFLVEQPSTQQRLALVVCDLGSMTHELHREVVERLQKDFGDSYTLSNVIISATHTHAAPGGFWHAGVGTPFGIPLHDQYFNVIVDGIVESIRHAHETAQPGRILMAQGTVPDAGINRSRVAYMNNPAEERARYDSDTDTTMTLLRFETADGPIGCLNWFAVHPTTMTYNNRLISGDNKGYAEITFERAQGVTDEQPNLFVAAFAQSNCGDVTGNLNLDNTGPGKDEFETTQIIGERQYIIAHELFDQADTELSGPVSSRQAFVDFSAIPVSDEFTGQGEQTTAEAAYGYAFAAGSTEDGGGHPLFREGMTQTAPLLELTLDQQFPDARPDDSLRQQHQPKAILIAPGNMPPTAGLSQTLSLTVARIGPLLLAAGPAEFTTMAGRRIRDTLADISGLPAANVVIAGYANGYAGYVTTFEEYETQQYEGGHTLFGPWTLAAYRQEYARLATAMIKNQPVESKVEVLDLRGRVPDTPLSSIDDVLPRNGNIGDQLIAPAELCERGQTATAAFRTGNPRNHYPHTQFSARVEYDNTGAWEVVATEADWSTKCRFKPSRNLARPFEVTVSWDIPASARPGRYRFVHSGTVTRISGDEADSFEFRGVSDSFRVE